MEETSEEKPSDVDQFRHADDELDRDRDAQSVESPAVDVILPELDPAKIHERIPLYKYKLRSRAARVHQPANQQIGSPYRTMDGKRWIIGRDHQLVKVDDTEQLTKKQRNKLKRDARAK